MKQNIINRGKSTNNNLKILEKKWNQRFTMEKIPKYDFFKDTNAHTINLGLIKKRIKKEKNQLNPYLKKIKKSKTNSSNLTLESRPNTNFFPKLITKTENEKADLFSIKFNNTCNNDNIFQYNSINNSINTDVSNKVMYQKIYDNIYDVKMNKTEANSKIINMNDKFKEEMKYIKELWKLLGITTEYQINFWKMLSKYTKNELIDQYLSSEKKDLLQFKLESEKLQKEINKRETDLDKLKQIEQEYFENENLYKLYNHMNEKNKLEGKDEEKFNKYRNNKIKIESEIESLFKLLRLHTINTVCLFNKYKNEYNYYFTSGKIDINQMNIDYKFNDAYLLKIKSDTNFLPNSSLASLYDFSKFENDPFFLSLLIQKEENSKFKYLTATEDTLNKINQCIFIIDQEEILHKMNQSKQEIKKLTYYGKLKQNPKLFGVNLKKESTNINRKKMKALLFNISNPLNQVNTERQFPLFNTALTENIQNNNNICKKYFKI